MLDNDTTSSADIDSSALRKYDLTLSTTSLSVSVDITGVLSWVNAELEESYIKHEKLSTIRNLETDWQDGNAFLCLAHRFYPTSIPRAAFDSLLDQVDEPNSATTFEARSFLAFSVFEKELALAPPTSTVPQTPIPLYIANLHQALMSITQPTTINGNSNNNDDGWTRRTEVVLSTIHRIRQLINELDFRPSSQDDFLGNNGTSPPAPGNESTPGNGQLIKPSTNEKVHTKVTTRDTGANNWEGDLDDIEQQLVELQRNMDEYHTWTDNHMDDDDEAQKSTPTQTEKRRRLALVQSVDNAYLSLQEYLEHGQQVLAVFRKRALFTQATAPIRQDLDWVQAEMLKTTTTDTGIKELEARVKHAGTLLEELIQQYSEQHQQQSMDVASTEIQPAMSSKKNNTNYTDLQQRQIYALEVDALEKKYKVVQSWVEDVRVWFVEAQRIRRWIGERIDLLENSDVPDGVLTQDLTVTADHVEDLNTNHETLEKEVELFDKEDMSRLRTHVKDLTVVSTKEKDLSPADTTTIEITFTTLTTLDRLMHLLNRRSYDLQVLTLRIFWENEFFKTDAWIQMLADGLNIFIATQARWKADDRLHDEDPNKRKITMAAILSQSSSLKSAVIDKLLEFETDISTFDQGQFTTTVNLYQELDDTSKMELPDFLESRQVGMEEAFEALVHKTTFARHVVEQYLTMVDFMDASGNLLYCYGYDLYEKLLQHTDKMYSLFLDQRNTYDVNDDFSIGAISVIDLDVLEDEQLVDENAYFQEHAVRLITDTASLIPYTETTHTLDQQENEEGNHRVHLAVKSRSSDLIFYGETLELKLAQYQKAIRWYAQLSNVYDELQHMQTRITDDISSANGVSHQLTSTFGDQVSELSDTWIHDKDAAVQWHRELQQHVDSIDTYETELGVVDDNIQALLDFYEQQPPSMDTHAIPTIVTETVKYLETSAEMTSSQLRKLASTLDQWKSLLSLMKDRQSWESQYLVATEWIAAQKQKCQHIRIVSAWSPSEDSTTQHQKDQNGKLSDAVSILELEWDDFKNHSLSSLSNAFEILSGYSFGSPPETTWTTQRQRQNGVLSAAETIDGILALARALLNQRLAITQFLDGAQSIRSKGTQGLKYLRWTVLKHDTDRMLDPVDGDYLVAVDAYNTLVVDIWQKWQSFDNGAVSVLAGTHQEILDLDQQCSNLEAYASEQYHQLLLLGDSLRDWENIVKEATEMRHDIKTWCAKVLAFDGRADDFYQTLVLERDTLLKSLSKDCMVTLADSGRSDYEDLSVKGVNERARDMDRLLQQWMEHDFGSLSADGETLNSRTSHFKEKLLGLTHDEHDNFSLDFADDVERICGRLDKLRSRASLVIWPLITFVLKLVGTFDERSSWELVYLDMSLILDQIRGRLGDVTMAKQEWLTNNHCKYSISLLHNLLATVKTIEKELNDHHGVFDVENKRYISMEKLYRNLMTDNMDSHPVQLPTDIELKHGQCQQSIQYIKSMVNQLDEDIRWLEAGVSWLQLAGERFETWEALMGDLGHFIEHNAKWSMGSDVKVNVPSDTCGDALSPLDSKTSLFGLQQRIDGLTTDISYTLDALQKWKSRHGTDYANGLDQLGVWEQRASQLESCLSDAKDYVAYASHLVDQQTKLQEWAKNVNQTKFLGEQAKMAMLIDHDNNIEVADEPLKLLATFDEHLDQVLDCAQNVNYPALPHLLVWKKSTISSDGNIENGDNDLVIHQYIQSQHEHLSNLSISLNGILSANERSTRLKALVDGYMTKASEFLEWVDNTDSKLRQLISDQSDVTIAWEALKAKRDMMDEFERSTNEHIDAHYHVLKDAANHCITTIQLDTDNGEPITNGGNSSRIQLDRVYSMQPQVDDKRKRLFNTIQQNIIDLEKRIQQAERSYWCKKILEKCTAINGEFDNANMEMVQDDQLNQWRSHIRNIKTTDLTNLRKLFVDEDIGNLDTVNQLILDRTTMACQQLGNRLQLISDDVDLQRRKRLHSDLTVSMMNFIDNTKSKLMEFHSTLGALPIPLAEQVDDEFYCQCKARLNSIIGDFGDHEGVYKQERDLFLSIRDDDDGGDVASSKMIEEQHQRVEIGWTELQQQMIHLEDDYHSMIQRRPIFDVLYEACSILDNIENLLKGAGNADVSGAQQNLDQVKRLLAVTTSNTSQHNRPMVPTADNRNGIYTTMDIIYQQRYEILLDRMGIIENQVNHHQKQQQLQKIYQRYQDKSDEIQMAALGEIAALQLLRLQNDNLPNTSVFDPLSGIQQYQQWAKQVESSEQVLQNLARETTSLATVGSMNGLEKGVVDEIDARYQLPLGKLKKEIEYEKSLLDLARRTLGLGKSSNNIASWLNHFEKAVDGISVDGSITELYDEKSNQVLEDEINGLEAKLRGFEPIMASLDKMNTTIQDITQLDGCENALGSQWKRSARNRFDQVNAQWRNCSDKLEKAKKFMDKTKHAAKMTLKIESTMAFLGDICDQVERLQKNSSLVELQNSSAVNNQDQQSQLNIFKKLPRDRDISSAEEKLAAIKRKLAVQGRTRRTELDQLFAQYNGEQSTDSVDGRHFMKQRNEMDALSKNVIETIDNTKHLLSKKKPWGRYLSMVDDIDLLLDSMDDVLLKADPLYQENSSGSKPSKAELRAKLIELNARYNYYSINIQQNLQRADETWTTLVKEEDDDMNQQKPILENYRQRQQTRWNSMVDQQVQSRQLELKKAMEQPFGIIEKKTRPRKSSMPTPKAAGAFTQPPRPVSRNSRPTKAVLGPSSLSSSATIRASMELQDGHRRLRTVSSTSTLTSNKKPPIGQHVSLSTSTTSSVNSIDWASSNKKRSPTPSATRKRPNSYVAQAGNTLDMEIGRIVNDTPYRIKVKMVPGEVGRYWFGDINPKLVYCRVLKSKMVMVRVGGGWTELSQFLRDHALLEGELIIPKKQNQMHTPIQEGYLETTTSLQRQRQQLLQQHLEQFQQQKLHSVSSIITTSSNAYLPPRTPTPTMKKSISTPPSKIDVLQHKGYKDGDKFFAVDRHGNQLEVKMTRFRQQEALPTSTTDRRRKLVKS